MFRLIRASVEPALQEDYINVNQQENTDLTIEKQLYGYWLTTLTSSCAN